MAACQKTVNIQTDIQMSLLLDKMHDSEEAILKHLACVEFALTGVKTKGEGTLVERVRLVSLACPKCGCDRGCGISKEGDNEAHSEDGNVRESGSECGEKKSGRDKEKVACWGKYVVESKETSAGHS